MSEFASIMTDKEEPSNISEFTNTVTEKEELSNVEPSNRNESTSIMTDIKESGYTSEFTDMAPTNEKEKSSNRSESTGASSKEMPRDMIIPTTLTTEKEESNITTEHTHTSNDEGRLNDKSLSTNSSTTEKEKLISNVNESANMPIDKEKQSAVGESTSFIIEKEALNGTIKESDGLLPEGRKYDKSEFVCEASFPLLENKDERTENEEFIEIDAEIDDALDEGYMGMECTLERGFSLNESAMQRDFWPDDYEETSPNYVHGNFPNRYSSALKHLIPIRKAPKDKDEMKVDKAGLFSFMSFSWITYLMWKAYKHGLNEDDIPLCSKFEMCQPNTQRLNSYWEEEVKEKGLAKASLHRPVWKFIRTRIIFSLFILICSLIFGFAGPKLHSDLLGEYESEKKSRKHPAKEEDASGSNAGPAKIAKQSILSMFHISKQKPGPPICKDILEKKILSLVANGLLSLSLVELHEFKDLLSYVNPAVQVPSRRTLARSLATTTSTMKEDIQAKLAAVDHVCVTCDIWSTNHRSFMGVTAHWTFFMRYLIGWLSTDEPLTVGIMWAVCLIFCEAMRITLFGIIWALNYRTAIRLRSALLGLVYKKLMNMSHLGNKSIGEVINLFANDGQRVFDFVTLGTFFISGPLVAIAGVIYILLILGPWALLGMTAFLFFYPCQYLISRLSGYLRRKTVTITDQRVRMMNEIFTCIKLIKMYAWEHCFTKSITEIRKRERRYLEKSAYIQSISVAMTPTVPVLAAIITFLAHIGAGYNLTPAQAFSVVAFLLRNMRVSLNMMRFSILAIVEYRESRKRLQAFSFIGALVRVRGQLHYVPYSVLSMIDFQIALRKTKSILCMKGMDAYVERASDGEILIRLKEVTFAWNAKSENAVENATTQKKAFLNKEKDDCQLKQELLLQKQSKISLVEVLYDLNIQIKKGELIAVCGGVGAGKSSLLLGLLGQMSLVKGTVSVGGECAYVGQEAWILNATLRDNILLGEEFDAKRYYKVMYACSLTEDVALLPGGDNTEIGERGVNLSGGQKQRVSLARALYCNKDIYFLDDCLSAVDAHVGQHIFQWVFRNALRNKTVIFVTHQLQYLPECHRVIYLRKGRIAEMGKHSELMAKGSSYSLLFKKHLETINKEKMKSKKSGAERESSLSKENTLNFSLKSAAEETLKIHSTSVKEGHLTSPEENEKGDIPNSVYRKYIVFCGGFGAVVAVIFTFLLNAASAGFSTWWLSLWLTAGSGNATITIGNETFVSENIGDNPDINYYKMIYGFSILFILVTSLVRGFAFMKTTILASSRMHSAVFKKMFRSPMSFFESTPSGRVINIFSRDMDEVDVRLPLTMETFLQNIWLILISLLFVSLVFPYFLIFLVFLAGIFLFIRHVFKHAVRDLKRFENISRSPVFTLINTTVTGLPSIQAYHKQKLFMHRYMKLADENSSRFFLFNCALRWLAIRLDLLALSVTSITAFLCVFLRNSVGAASAGLALAYASQLSGIFQYTVRLSTETEARFTSVQRIVTYIETLISEAPLIIKGNRPNKNWPKFGRISFKKVELKYRSETPLALKGISFEIDSQEKIGVIGRTGSGKSSLGAALFRLVELKRGAISIDGINIASVGLEDLRSRLSIIPQDPVLFIGTVRYNLDPFERYSDAEVWEALEKTRMKATISALDLGFSSPVVENGSNFSVGERQLLCMARALLRKSKILFLDEATAGIDTETDSKIQSTLKEAFKDCTMITVAHRLNTIMNCSRVLVMDNGSVAEFDSPETLLNNPSSKFSKLVAASKKGLYSV